MSVCLAGETNKKAREAVLKAIDDAAGVNNFIILFKGALGRQDLRGIYGFDAVQGTVNLVSCLKPCPASLDVRMVSHFFRYDSGVKEFRLLEGTKSFSMCTDAVALHPQFLPKQKAQDVL
eukprot:GILI01016335.1.p1 GENE.GILI01016335.1~~GILI01016335.1.p1  ORF type:complete len:120 (-),score=26.24 GILI01016335.1:58-417(-)